MDFSRIHSWQDLWQQTPEVEIELSLRETAVAALEHMAGICVADQDEGQLLKLLKILAREANWIDSELHVQIAKHSADKRLCSIWLLSAGGFKEVLKRFTVPASFQAFRTIVRRESVAPFIIHPDTTADCLVLAAPKLKSLRPPPGSAREGVVIDLMDRKRKPEPKRPSSSATLAATILQRKNAPHAEDPRTAVTPKDGLRSKHIEPQKHEEPIKVVEKRVAEVKSNPAHPPSTMRISPDKKESIRRMLAAIVPKKDPRKEPDDVDGDWDNIPPPKKK